MARYGESAQKSVKKEMHHRKTKKHGTMSKKQAIAVGLSKARRKGAKVPKRKRSRGGRKKK
jgi:hypothetical protein